MVLVPFHRLTSHPLSPRSPLLPLDSFIHVLQVCRFHSFLSNRLSHLHYLWMHRQSQRGVHNPTFFSCPRSTNQPCPSDIICHVMLQSPAQSVTRIRHKRHVKANQVGVTRTLSPSRLSPVMAMSDVHTRHKQKNPTLRVYASSDIALFIFGSLLLFIFFDRIVHLPLTLTWLPCLFDHSSLHFLLYARVKETRDKRVCVWDFFLKQDRTKKDM